MKTTTITQPTRNAARKLKADMVAAGKVATVIDNGSQFKGNDRWGVKIEGREVLAAPRKPHGGVKVEVCNSSPQHMRRRGFVKVMHKRNKLQ